MPLKPTLSKLLTKAGQNKVHFRPVKLGFILGQSGYYYFASFLATKTIKMIWGHIHKNLKEDKNLGVKVSILGRSK